MDAKARHQYGNEFQFHDDLNWDEGRLTFSMVGQSQPIVCLADVSSNRIHCLNAAIAVSHLAILR